MTLLPTLRQHSLPAILATTLALFSLSAVQAREMVSVKGDKVHMRDGAGTNHDVLWTLSKGYPMDVIGRKGNWLRVRDFESDTGWIYRPLTSKTAHFIVKSDKANVRSGPSTRNKILETAVYGDVMRTLAHKGRWVKVKRLESGTTGWVAKSLLWGW